MPTTTFPTDNLINMIKVQAQTLAQMYSTLKFARIAEYDPKKCRVKVWWHNPMTDDYDLISGWLKYMTSMQGIGDDSEAGVGELWGHVYTPNVGEQVMLVSPEGNHNVAIVIGSIYTDKRPPPTQDDKYCQSGEWMYKNKSGSYIKFFNNGDVTVYATGNLNFHADKNINTHAVGQITEGAESTMTLTGNSIMLNANAQVLSNAPATNSTQNLSAGNGATGSFTSPTGQIISVVDGIVVNIADSPVGDLGGILGGIGGILGGIL